MAPRVICPQGRKCPGVGGVQPRFGQKKAPGYLWYSLGLRLRAFSAETETNKGQTWRRPLVCCYPPAVAAAYTPDGIKHIFRWDLDKTYLRTEFDTWVDLMRTAIERPASKRTVPGA